MKEIHVYTLAIVICTLGLIASLWEFNLLGALGFGMGLIGSFSSRWFYVRWNRAGRP